ncbi:MAG: hypothetical protein R3C49_16580 [Planctomycetaceae bacterium]
MTFLLSPADVVAWQKRLLGEQRPLSAVAPAAECPKVPEFDVMVADFSHWHSPAHFRRGALSVSTACEPMGTANSSFFAERHEATSAPENGK